MYVLYAWTKKEPQKPPEHTSEDVKPQNFLGACPQTPSHNLYYGLRFLYLPWAPPILSAALIMHITRWFLLGHRGTYIFCARVKLMGQGTLPHKASSKGASPNYFFQNNVIVTLSWNPPPPPKTSHLRYQAKLLVRRITVAFDLPLPSCLP